MGPWSGIRAVAADVATESAGNRRRADGERMMRVLAVIELPSLDERRCVSCGDCIYVCPTDCLAFRGPYPWLPRPLACVSCPLYVFLFPLNALSLAPPQSP